MAYYALATTVLATKKYARDAELEESKRILPLIVAVCTLPLSAFLPARNRRKLAQGQAARVASIVVQVAFDAQAREFAVQQALTRP